MKGKFMIVALIAMIMVAGLVMVSCGASCPGSGNCTYSVYCGENINYGWSDKQIEKATQCALDALAAAFSGDDSFSCTCK